MEALGDTRTSGSGRKRNVARSLWKDARYRATKKNLPFNIQVSDIVVPDRCPVFGKPLSVSETGRASEWSPSLDRIVPEMGYTKGNIVVVSHRVNSIKTNATIEELRAIAEYYQQNLNILMGLNK